MKRRWIALALLLALAVSLTACQVEFIPHGQPENNGGTTIDTPPLPGGDTDPVDVTDPVGGDEEPSGGNTDYTMENTGGIWRVSGPAWRARSRAIGISWRTRKCP